MGASESKPSTPEPSHIWKSETPVRFSQDLVDSLQSSTESDSTRSKTLELHIQARVAEELKRLQEREEQLFKDISEKLSSEESTASDSSKAGDSNSSAGDAFRGLSRESIQNELASLKKKLENRKKVKEVGELDKSVEKAREDVISCLRGNDRRPLDCWREVEAFKREVGRVEKDWVEKVVR